MDFLVLIILLFAGYFRTCGSISYYVDHRGRRQMDIDLKKDNATTATADASVDDVVVDFSNMHVSLFSKYEAFVIIRSPAFQFVDQTISIDVRSGLGGPSGECLHIGQHVGGNIVSIPGIPISFCNTDAANRAKNMRYSLNRDLYIRVTYSSWLMFKVHINMHALDNDGRRWVSDQSNSGLSDLHQSALLLNMNTNAGKTLVIKKRSAPIRVYYKHGKYGAGSTTLKIESHNHPFNRIGLHFIDYKELNGFCIYAKNIGSYGGKRWCMNNPPRLEGLDDSVFGRRRSELELTVNGSGSAFMSFSVLVTTFYEGFCYNKTCDNGVCVPSDQVCRGGNPCGDYSDCRVLNDDSSSTAMKLVVFCSVITIISLAVEYCWHIRRTRPPEEESPGRRRQEPDIGTRMTPREGEPRNVPPSAPAQEMQFIPPSVPPSAPPNAQPSAPAPSEAVSSDLPPSYDEVISEPEKYGGPNN